MTGPNREKRRAVVFAYHDVGVRCLLTLLARGIDVALVVTHRDNPDENVWFGRVADVAAEHGLALRYAEDLDADALHAAVAAARPDFLFSFYFRSMLPAAILALAPAGSYNMHGSLLPKYRGRVPINWAIIHGETETGATLHEMVAKPDAGAILGQTVVPILPDDTAHEVFGKVVVAAEQTLWRVLPDLVAGHPFRMPNDLAQGSYFGGRRPEDGRIDWSQAARSIHNLVRAVAPPYPGAFTTIDGRRVIVERTRIPADAPRSEEPATLRVAAGRAIATAGDGEPVEIVVATIDGKRFSSTPDCVAADLAAALGDGAHRLGDRS
jgi:methionyl-tRNA formyltransferase